MKLTETAIAKALTMRSNDKDCLRISVKGGGCSGFLYELEFDEYKIESDEVLVYGELTVIIDAKSAKYLVNTELDYTDGLNASGFQFKNSDASSTCGCGSSFGCP